MLFPSNGYQYTSAASATSWQWATAHAEMNFYQGKISIKETGSGTKTVTFGPGGYPSAVLVLQTDGNLVIYPNSADFLANTGAVWASNTRIALNAGAGTAPIAVTSPLYRGAQRTLRPAGWANLAGVPGSPGARDHGVRLPGGGNRAAEAVARAGVSRNLAMDLDDRLGAPRFLIHDRDPVLTTAFGEVLKAEGLRIIPPCRGRLG